MPAATVLPAASVAPAVSVVTSNCPEESAISAPASTSVVPESVSE